MLPSDNLVPLANRLAESLCSEAGLAAFRLMVRLQNLNSKRESAKGKSGEPKSEAGQVARIGIWERQTTNGKTSFVRTSDEQGRHLWADVEELASSSEKQRVVLIGESVARGFFYDPHVTPASLLGAMLSTTAEGDVEVVDLARIDLQMKQLLDLAESAAALEPDAIVIFAGNNWHPITGLTQQQLSEIALLVENSRSWTVVKDYLEERLREQVKSLLAELGEIQKNNGIPILLLIPEFNLLDWRSECDAPPLLDDDDLLEWLSIQDRAKAALAEGRTEEAAKLARALIDLDGGTTPVGFNIQARLHRDAGATSGLRPLLEKARDAGISLTKHQTPRCFGTIQQVLREDAGQYDIRLIDLPSRFEDHLGGDIPGRRLFNDYCHLTLEGMRVAMASAAEQLLPILSRPPRTWRSLLTTEFAVADKAIAEASFLAAVHNANWDNGAELVKFHLTNAIKQYPRILTLMRAFLDFHVRSAPSPLCAAFEQMARTENLSLVSRLFRSPRVEKNINFELVRAIVEVLEPFQSDITEYVRELLIAEHSTTVDRNLLEKFYSGMTSEQSWDQDRYGYYRACRRESRFVFICDEPEDTKLRITSRTNAGGSGQKIVIRVNGVAVDSFVAATRWQNVVLTVPGSVLSKGINELEIVWPEKGWAFPTRAAGIVKTLDEGRVPEAGPIFGEVHMLLASSLGASRSASGDSSLIAVEASTA